MVEWVEGRVEACRSLHLLPHTHTLAPPLTTLPSNPGQHERGRGTAPCSLALHEALRNKKPLASTLRLCATPAPSGGGAAKHLPALLRARLAHCETNLSCASNAAAPAAAPHQSSPRMQGRGKRETPEKTRLPVGPTCDPYAKIRERPRRESKPFRLGGRQVVWPLHHRGPAINLYEDRFRFPAGLSPGSSHVRIVPDDGDCWWVYSGISRFPCPYIPHSPRFPHVGSQDLDVESRPNLPAPLLEVLEPKIN
ncbi:hypothetical protein PR048_007977 [Dryococelus australis]|uniref:Uncharacterized protein n=1 Tax=Dryococelus australis TaxID=614101 RepID=A0ABQ9HWL8_9NEOP|nr:hypothetical protein PR048_007977 [Dryococelus australis]